MATISSQLLSCDCGNIFTKTLVTTAVVGLVQEASENDSLSLQNLLTVFEFIRRYTNSVYVCTVTVVVGVDAELDEDEVADVNQAEDVIVSQWKELSADERHQYRDQVDEIFRPLGYETSLVVIRRANSIAMLFICLTLSAIMGLREQWRSGQLRDIVKELFNLLSPRTAYVKRLIWPLTDFERCLRYFDTQGKQTSHTNTGYH